MAKVVCIYIQKRIWYQPENRTENSEVYQDLIPDFIGAEG